MKHAMALLIPYAALVIGCREENDMPNAPNDHFGSKTELAKVLPCKRIELALALHAPGEFNSLIEVRGSVEYAASIHLRDPVPPHPDFSILIDLIVNAELRPHEQSEPVWRISATTQDDVLPNDQGTMLEKRIWVAGLNKWLCLAFRVSETTLELKRSWIEVSKVVTAKDET